jgi:Uma2 family endonuclease
VRVPDVAWASADFRQRQGTQTPFTAAPEICVEVRSPFNSDDEMALKTRLYIEAGAIEVWIINETGAIVVFGAAGELASSRWPITVALR